MNLRVDKFLLTVHEDSALNLAACRGHTEVVAFMINHGGSKDSAPKVVSVVVLDIVWRPSWSEQVGEK